MKTIPMAACLLMLLMICGCAKPQVGRRMEVTAYCGCSACCQWERGHWQYLKLDFWNRYVSKGPRQGDAYTGKTASGTIPREPRSGLFSTDSLKHPWMIPVRLVLLPWYLRSRDGTVAADTRHYPFGTRMVIPGYGIGRVEDRGAAIKGQNRLDVYFDSHAEALRWGRRQVYVRLVD